MKSELWYKTHRNPEYRERQRQSALARGAKPPVQWGNKTNIGRKHTAEWKQRMSEKMKGRHTGYKYPTGKDHPNWKGGISELRKNLLGMFEYRQWRSDVFQRDNFTCQDCGKKGGDLEPHHIKEVAEIIKEYQIKTLENARNCAELWNINNGITLCKECHRKTFRYH